MKYLILILIIFLFGCETLHKPVEISKPFGEEDMSIQERIENQARLEYLIEWYEEEKQKGTQNIEEKWSSTYKKSIDCSNAKGFSQKAHCAGRNKKKNESNK